MSFRDSIDNLATQPLNQIRLSWDQCDRLAIVLAASINMHTEAQTRVVLHTAPNGGLWVAALLSRHLNVKPIVQAFAEGYDRFTYYPQGGVFHCFVDDILDTGKATKLVLTAHEDRLTELSCYYLVNKPGAHRIYTPKWWCAGSDVPEKCFVQFPWEPSEC